jgi:hypothetical protein
MRTTWQFFFGLECTSEPVLKLTNELLLQLINTRCDIEYLALDRLKLLVAFPVKSFLLLHPLEIAELFFINYLLELARSLIIIATHVVSQLFFLFFCLFIKLAFDLVDLFFRGVAALGQNLNSFFLVS